jgi:polyhydroxyalkanoate synthase
MQPTPHHITQTPNSTLLPLQMMLALLNWQSCYGALNAAKLGLELSKMPSVPLTPETSAWLSLLRTHPQLSHEVSLASHQRFQDVLRGIQQYRSATFERYYANAPVFAQQGAGRVLHYAAQGMHTPRAVMLFIPSLINRYYIMDLSEQRSMMRYLTHHGITCYLADWGDPSDHEIGYDCAAYVNLFLQPMLQHIRAAHPDTPLYVTGHCMGGVLAAGLAAQQPQGTLAGLALLATPWDFSPHAMQTPALTPRIRETLESLIDQDELFAGDHMLALFYLRDPWLFQDKLRQLPTITDPHKRQHFIALESWANDCVDLTRGVARDCLIHWGASNYLMKGRWQAGGAPLVPERLAHLKLLLAIPEYDRIVPPASTAPLAQKLPHATILHPQSGHVGMLVGARAQEQLWQPLRDWALQ